MKENSPIVTGLTIIFLFIVFVLGLTIIDKKTTVREETDIIEYTVLEKFEDQTLNPDDTFTTSYYLKLQDKEGNIICKECILSRYIDIKDTIKLVRTIRYKGKKIDVIYYDFYDE